jgi:hypothetical protein
MEQNPSLENSSHSRSQEITRLLRNSIITVFTRAHHRSPSWAKRIQFLTSHHISLKSILISSYNPRLRLPSGLFPSGFPTETQYAFLNSSICALCSTHFILLDSITLTFHEAYKLRSSSLCSLLQPPAAFSRLGLNILHSILYSDTSR